MFKDITLIAIWDGIEQTEMDCKLNTDTKQVFNIKIPNAIDSFNCFQGFYLNIDNILQPVVPKNEAKDGEHWYE